MTLEQIYLHCLLHCHCLFTILCKKAMEKGQRQLDINDPPRLTKSSVGFFLCRGPWFPFCRTFTLENFQIKYFPALLRSSVQFSSVQSLSHVWLFATPWTTARQASLSITNSHSSPKPMFIESVIPSNHRILCHRLLLCPQSFPASGSFQMNQLFASGGQSIGASASTSVLPMNTQDWSPLGWTGWLSFQPKGLSRVFSNTTVQKHQFFDTQLSL